MEAVIIQRLEIGYNAINVKNGITALVLELQMPQLAGIISSIFVTFANNRAVILCKCWLLHGPVFK